MMACNIKTHLAGTKFKVTGFDAAAPLSIWKVILVFLGLI